jgi:hypothetical protein
MQKIGVQKLTPALRSIFSKLVYIFINHIRMYACIIVYISKSTQNKTAIFFVDWYVGGVCWVNKIFSRHLPCSMTWQYATSA